MHVKVLYGSSHCGADLLLVSLGEFSGDLQRPILAAV